MSYQSEFPGFVLDVDIPAGFEDSSWHNDECPTWVDAKHHMQLFIRAEEGKGSPRFLLVRITDAVEFVKTLVETNKWQEILAYLALKGRTRD